MGAFKKLIVLLLLALFSVAASAAITDAEIIAYAAAKYPTLFSGAAISGQYQNYSYWYYPGSQNYLAVDTTGVIYIMGPVSGGAIIAVGTVESFTPAITAWDATMCTSDQVYTNGACSTPEPTVNAQTIDTISFSPATLTLGGSTTVSATATSGLAVSFSSVTPDVCSVSGNAVTGVAAGTCVIAADQVGNDSYYAATQATSSIQVMPPTCTSPQELANGVCVTPPPTLPTGYVFEGGLIWMPVTGTTYRYAEANAFCWGSINGQTGWRLPTQAELAALHTSGAMYDQGWVLSHYTWSSTPDDSGNHYSVLLDNGDIGLGGSDMDYNFVTCVR